VRTPRFKGWHAGMIRGGGGLKRRWLEIWLAGAAVVVAAASVYVAFQANKIASRQASIQSRQIEPTITAHLAYQFANGRAVSQTLYVQNIGAPATAVNVDLVTLYHATFERRSQSAQDRLIPLLDYYNSMGSTGNPSGLLATAFRAGNNDAAAHLERESSAYAQRRHDILVLDLVQDVKVSYTDELGQRHTDYLRVDPVAGASPLSTQDGSAAFATNAQGLAHPSQALELATATPKRVFRIASLDH
jgi:hypothetical protein